MRYIANYQDGKKVLSSFPDRRTNPCFEDNIILKWFPRVCIRYQYSSGYLLTRLCTIVSNLDFSASIFLWRRKRNIFGIFCFSFFAKDTNRQRLTKSFVKCTVGIV